MYYKEFKTKTKAAVSEAKLKVFKEVFDELDSTKGEKDKSRMAKRRRAKTNYISVKRIMDKDKNILVQDENIKDRWREYVDEIFKEEQGHVVGDTKIIFLDEKRI